MENIVMTLRQFAEYIISQLSAFLPEELQDAKIEAREVKKNNGVVLTGIVVKNGNIFPTVYLDEFYDKYNKNEMNFSDILKSLADVIVRNMPGPIQINNITDWDPTKLTCRLVNAKANRSKLNGVPHRIIAEDLALIYGKNVSDLVGGGETGQAIIWFSEENYSLWGDHSEEELFEAAMKNAAAETEVQDMAEMFEKMGMPPMMGDGPRMTIVTNISKVNGATQILLPEVREQLSKLYGGYDQFVLIPSSIHEFLAVPAGVAGSPLVEMIAEVNATQLAPEEVLGSHPYAVNLDGELVSAVEAVAA